MEFTNPPSWLALTHAKGTTIIKEYKSAWSQLNVSSGDHASFVLLIGRKTKSEVLRQWMGVQGSQTLAAPHGEVILWGDRTSSDNVYIDFELQSYDKARSSAPKSSGETLTRVAHWLGGIKGPITRRRVGNLLSARAIAPLCNTVCYFASDFGGPKGVASLLAAQLSEDPSTDLPMQCLPNVLVVVDTPANEFDSQAVEASIMEMIAEIMVGHDGAIDVRARLALHYSQFRLLGIRRAAKLADRARQVRKELLIMQQDSLARKTTLGWNFKLEHIIRFSRGLLDNFCMDEPQQFSFISASRPDGFSQKDLAYHLKETIAILPSQVWINILFCPLLASSIILATYPSGSHCKT